MAVIMAMTAWPLLTRRGKGFLGSARFTAAALGAHALFQAVLWLVVPALLALVVYYCLQPLTRALIRAGLNHGTAAKVVAGVLFLGTVLFLLLLFSVAVAHAESGDGQV